MVAATIVTAASLPIYWVLFHALNVVGLALASDIGIFANTAVLAWLLHREGLVSLNELPWGELGKAFAIAVLAGAAAMFAARAIPIYGRRVADVESLGIATLTWAGGVAAGLWLTRSALLRDVLVRKRPVMAENTASAPQVQP